MRRKPQIVKPIVTRALSDRNGKGTYVELLVTVVCAAVTALLTVLLVKRGVR